jgi:hypothetical protein
MIWKWNQWKALPIQPSCDGRAEIHYTRIYRTFRRWASDGCIDAIFTGSVQTLFDSNLLDTSVVHGDGTTTVAKKGGDNIGFSGHKHIKGDKVVSFCDRNCNVIAPFIAAPGNRNESPLLRETLPQLTGIAKAIGIDLRGSIVSLDGVYDGKANRKGDLQPWHGSQHQREPARQKDHQARTQTLVQCGHLQRTLSHHRTRVRLGR